MSKHSDIYVKKIEKSLEIETRNYLEGQNENLFYFSREPSFVRFVFSTSMPMKF